MIYLKSCTKCRGDILRTELGNLVTLTCIQCAYTVEGKQQQKEQDHETMRPRCVRVYQTTANRCSYHENTGPMRELRSGRGGDTHR